MHPQHCGGPGMPAAHQQEPRSGGGRVGKVSGRDWRRRGEDQPGLLLVGSSLRLALVVDPPRSSPLQRKATTVKASKWLAAAGRRRIPAQVPGWSWSGDHSTGIWISTKNPIRWWLDWRCCPKLAHNSMIQGMNWSNSACNNWLHTFEVRILPFEPWQQSDVLSKVVVGRCSVFVPCN